MQNGSVIAYASRSLNSAEAKYAQIEKELLAIVFATKKFNDFIYGRPVEIETDHKPLVAIVGEKDMDKVSARFAKNVVEITKV